MKYDDLADGTPEKAWDAFLCAEEEYKRDPTNRDKFLRARKAFQAYDAVRVKLHFPDEQQ